LNFVGILTNKSLTLKKIIMKQKFLLFIISFIFNQLIFAQNVGITNDDLSIALTGTWGCTPASGFINGPSTTGNYIVRVEWTDFGGNAQVYQTPLASPNLITVNNYGTAAQATVINCASLSGYSDPTHFPDDANEFYSLADVSNVSIKIQTPNLATTWIISFTNGVEDQCVILPIYIENYTAVNSGGNALLNWRTYNDYYAEPLTKYEVERATGNPNVSWETWAWERIGTVPAVNAQGWQNYSFTDSYPAGNKYYRIKAYKAYGRVDKSDPKLVQGLLNAAQPPAMACNYLMNGTNGLCINSTAFYSLNDYPDYSNITWTATPFYVIPNSYSFTVKEANLTRLMVLNPNVITLTANVSRCSSGGAIVKYIYKGKPPVKKTSTTQVTTNPCNGFITSSSKTITVTPFPGSVSTDYQWYLDNVFVGTGLTNTFSNSTNQQKICEIRFNGPCGVSVANDSIVGITCLPVTIPTNTTSSIVRDRCTGVIISSSTTLTVSPFSCSVAGGYQWYINGVYSGTGLSRTFNTLNNPTYNYEIRYNGPCGLSTATGIIGGFIEARIEFAKVGPNPVVGSLKINSRPAPCLRMASLSEKSTQITSIEIFDMMGNLVKQVSFKIPVEQIDLNVQNIKRGNYRLKINYAKTSEVVQIKLVD
jgi:Secretion system C-terminal sorting domain